MSEIYPQDNGLPEQVRPFSETMSVTEVLERTFFSEIPKVCGQRWQHLKTGHVYTVVGYCQLEATNEQAVLYTQGTLADPTVWVRAAKEFYDGRFVRLS